MDNEVRVKKGIKTVNLLRILTGLIIARFSCIALSNIPIFNMSFTFLYGCAFVILFSIQYPKITRREFYGMASLFVYVIFVIVRTLDYGLFNTQAFNAYVLCFMYFIYLYMKRCPTREAMGLGLIAVLGYMLTLLYSIPVLLIDPDLSRKAAASIVTENSADTLNAVGGFDTVYGTLLLIVFFIIIRNAQFSTWNRGIVTSALVVSCIFLVLASYGTALVLLVLIFAIAIFKKNKFWSAVILLLVVLGVVYRVQIGNALANFALRFGEMKSLGTKINDISHMLITGEAAGTLAGDDGRFARMGWSISTFFQYPILGGIGKPDAMIGSHSEIFDLLARFGLVGATLLLIFMVIFMKDLFQFNTQQNGKQCLKLMLIIYLFISVLDPALYTQQVMPFFCIAPIIELMYRKERMYEEAAGFSSL